MTVPEAMAMIRDAKTEQARIEATVTAVRELGEGIRHNLNDDEYGWCIAIIHAREGTGPLQNPPTVTEFYGERKRG